MADFIGSDNFRDVLTGTTGNDFMNGKSGNDNLSGAAGDDNLQGGPGNDELAGGDGRDRLVGGAGDDGLSGGTGDDVLQGNAGNDRLAAQGGADLLQGGTGNDQYTLTDRAVAEDSGGSDNEIYFGDMRNGANLRITDGGGARDELQLADIIGTLNGTPLTNANTHASQVKGTNNLLIVAPNARLTIVNYFSTGRIETITLTGRVPLTIPAGSRVASAPGVVGATLGDSMAHGQAQQLVQAMSAFSGASSAAAQVPLQAALQMQWAVAST